MSPAQRIVLYNYLRRDEKPQTPSILGVEFAASLSACQFNEISCKDDTNVLQSLKDLVKVVDKRTGGMVPKDSTGGCVIS